MEDKWVLFKVDGHVQFEATAPISTPMQGGTSVSMGWMGVLWCLMFTACAPKEFHFFWLRD